MRPLTVKSLTVISDFSTSITYLSDVLSFVTTGILILFGNSTSNFGINTGTAEPEDELERFPVVVLTKALSESNSINKIGSEKAVVLITWLCVGNAVTLVPLTLKVANVKVLVTTSLSGWAVIWSFLKLYGILLWSPVIWGFAPFLESLESTGIRVTGYLSILSSSTSILVIVESKSYILNVLNLTVVPPTFNATFEAPTEIISS